MNRFARLLASALSLSILLTAGAPYQAAAQAVTVRAVPAGAIGALGASGVSLGSFNSASPVLPAASLPSAGLVPALAPSALTPAISAPVQAAPLSPAASVEAARASAVSPRALAAAAAPAAATSEKSAPVQAIAALRTGGAALSAAAKSEAADAPRVALDALFEGSAAKTDALSVSARSAASDSPRLDPSSSREPAKGPRWVKTFRPEGPNTPSSLKRTFSVGFLAAVVPIALTVATVAIAQLLGYHMHPNYQGPAGAATTTFLQSLAIWAGAAIMAPVSEEAIFRGGLQGRLAKLSAKLHLGDFAVPALITSVIFVALHETADPVLFGTRLVHAMILSYVYKKEGILASMAAHGFFNGLLALSIVFTALHAPALALLSVPASIYFAIKARGVLKAQKPAVDAGQLAPKPLTAKLAFLMAAVLMLGYFFIMPNIIWPVGAIALLIAGIKKLKQ